MNLATGRANSMVASFVGTALAVVAILSSASEALAQQRVAPDTDNQKIRVMAIVNGQQITRQQIADECLRRHGKAVLEGIIKKHLVFSECKRRNLVITRQDVEAELDRMAKKVNPKMTAAEYIKLISEQRNVSPDRLRNDIIWMELALRRLAATEIQVTQADIDREIQMEYGPRVQVRVIALDNAKNAEQVHQMALNKPEEFGSLAKDFSVDRNTASVKGMLPPIRRTGNADRFEQIAFSLKEGQISEVFQLDNPDPAAASQGLQQFLILKCERHFPATQLSPDQIKLVESRLVERMRAGKLAESAGKLFRRLQETVKVVNVYNDKQLRQQMPGVAATVNGEKISIRYLAEECIALFGHEVLDTEINRTIILQALRKANKNVSDEDVRAEVARAANSYGFKTKEGGADIERWLNFVTKNDQSKIEVYVDDEVWPSVAMKKLVEDGVNVDDTDMQRGWKSNYGERVEVLAIVMNDFSQAQRVWKMATDNPTEKHFGELANTYSVEPASRANFGQVPAIQQYGGRKNLEDEAFKLAKGEISGLVNVGKFWIVLYCLGRTEPVVQDFDSVKDELYADILEKKMRIAMDTKFTSLVDSAQIDNFLTGTSRSGKQAAMPAPNQRR